MTGCVLKLLRPQKVTKVKYSKQTQFSKETDPNCPGLLVIEISSKHLGIISVKISSELQSQQSCCLRK